MARKRSVPITQRDIPTANPLARKKKLGKSHKSTQSTISLFHTLLKRKAQAQKALSSACSSSQASALQAQLAAVEQEIAEQGGLDTYQRASTLGQSSERGGDSSVVLIEWLKELNEASTREAGGGGGTSPLRMLEIGALSPNNYAAKQFYITNTPIDLNSQHPDILAQDFLHRPLPKDDSERFDIVSCSLVLNFVPEPRDREHLETILGVVGFALVKRRARSGGKVIYSLWKWQKPNTNPQAVKSASKRAELRSGTKRNNFVVLLK
ncbi:hypothetical protein QFC22_001932 [Naganishia vaughanmartiniae]|uniref:Uncharacterized protein n=1 Tax=Naganishia vaughanmartiniae TaxID=1424756 RepID=A0ACC2XFA8_9TREE|nr:hypothetical protein QFC22_001932 [Naganishia vaughanmartiniae]